jgi:hypothetical protein
MRYPVIASLCLVAACSDGGGGAEEKKAEEQAATIEAGQWETSFEVTELRSTDKATPAVKAKAGDKMTSTTCVTEANKAEPPPELFAGQGYKCSYKTSYIRNGRLNASLACRHSSVSGEMVMSVNGSYSAASFEGTVSTTTYLPGDGDFQMTRNITGRKTAGACTAEAPAQKSRAGKGG